MTVNPVSDQDFALNVEDTVNAQAWTTWNNYRQYTELDDLKQEGMIWVLEHPKEVGQYLEHEKPRLAYWWLSRDIWKVMDRYARNERAQRIGYEPDDEAFYGKAVLDALLGAVLTGNPIQPQGEQQEGKSNRDPAEGGTFLAMYLDVERAWKTANLSPREREIVEMVYADGYTQHEAAKEIGIAQPNISKTIKRAFDKMIDKIGGQYPPNEE
jgi:RNA polymerase sigma factor (sigma-70 family)